MKRTVLPLLATITFSCWFATAHAQQSPVSAGGVATGSGGSLSYSVGQVDYEDLGGTGKFNQGVQQAEVHIAKPALDPQSKLAPTIPLPHALVYPNPTTNYVTLAIQDKIEPGMAYALYTAEGKLVATQKITSAQQNISLANLSQGVYFLTLVNNGMQSTSFTIIKTR